MSCLDRRKSILRHVQTKYKYICQY
jgi:hypothetical protein